MPGATASPCDRRTSGLWQFAAAAACAAGAGTKEIAAAVPLLVFLYDRMFLAGSFREAWKRRKYMYAGMSASWLLLAILIASTEGRGSTVGLSFPSITPYHYALTQSEAIINYIALAFWPSPLTFDYGYPDAGVPIHRTFFTCWPWASAVIGLLAATAVAIVRSHPAGYLGAWFFAFLAPTSSFIPIVTEPVAEHRMYLPLAAIVIGFVTAMCFAARSLAAFLFAFPARRDAFAGTSCVLALLAAATALGAATAARNEDYRSQFALWSHTVKVRPSNPRARTAMGSALLAMGRVDEAVVFFREAISLWPDYYLPYFEMGRAMLRQDRRDEAISFFRIAVSLEPNSSKAWRVLAETLAEAGRVEEAAGCYERAAQGARYPGELAIIKGRTAEKLGRLEEAEKFFREAMRIEPLSAAARNDLANVLMKKGDIAGAMELYREAIRLKPDYAEALWVFPIFAKVAGRKRR